jgi:hypothetical protein
LLFPLEDGACIVLWSGRLPDCHGLILTTPFEFAIWGNNTDFKVYKRFGPWSVRPPALGREAFYRPCVGWNRRKLRA